MKTKLVALSLLYLIALPSSGVSPGTEALSARTDPEAVKIAVQRASSASFFSLQIYLRRSFDVPVSYEWPYVDENGVALPWPDIDPWLDGDEDLRSALEMLPTATKGKLSWSEIRGNICILPPVDANGTENTLDTVVSLQIQNGSTWDALKQLALEINRGVSLNRRTRFFPRFLVHSREGPPEFREGNKVSLDLKDVTAREALCAIIHESPFEMAYSYSTHYRPDISPKAKKLLT